MVELLPEQSPIGTRSALAQIMVIDAMKKGGGAVTHFLCAVELAGASHTMNGYILQQPGNTAFPEVLPLEE